MSDRRARARRPMLQPEDIIDAALALTARRGLDGWGVRDITGEIGASMSSIYHHVGGKDEIARRVVERVLGELALPGAGLEWREWFIALLFPLKAKLAPYPGVAQWIAMHGPVFPQLMPALDAAIAVLQRAGFAERTGLVYATIFNAAVANIAMSDERKRHADDGPRDHASIMDRLHEHSEASPGGRLILETLSPFVQDAETASAAADAHYLFLLTSLTDGIDLTLPSEPPSS